MKTARIDLKIGYFYVIQSKGKRVSDAFLESIRDYIDRESREIERELQLTCLMQIQDDQPRFYEGETVNVFDHSLQKITGSVVKATYTDCGYDLILKVRK